MPKDWLVDIDVEERTKRMFLTSLVLTNAINMAAVQKLAKTDERYAENLMNLAAMYGFKRKRRLTHMEVEEIGRCAELLLTFADLKVRTIRFADNAFELMRKIPEPDLGNVFTSETFWKLERAIEDYKELYGLDNNGNPRRNHLDKRYYQDRIDMPLLVQIARKKNVAGFGFFEDVRSVMLTLGPKGREFFGKGARGSLLQGAAPIVPLKDMDQLKKQFGMLNTVLCYVP